MWNKNCWKDLFCNRFLSLSLSCRRPLSYRNQSIDLLFKSMDWFLYDNGLHHERVKVVIKVFIISLKEKLCCCLYRGSIVTFYLQVLLFQNCWDFFLKIFCWKCIFSVPETWKPQKSLVQESCNFMKNIFFFSTVHFVTMCPYQMWCQNVLAMECF